MTPFIALALLVGSALAGTPAPTPKSPVVVVSNYDGDTVTLATGDKVRLLLANTTEMKPEEAYAAEARDFTHRLVVNKEVTLRVAENPRDAYGRLLAGISVDGQDLAMELLRAGLAHLYIVPPAEVDTAPYLAAQEEARAARKGIWVTSDFQGPLHITSFHANGIGDDVANPDVEYFRICNITPTTLDLNGFRVANAAGQSWTLPEVHVPAGNTVKIHSGVGGNQTDANRQLELFLGSAKPIWNDVDDHVTIYDASGGVAAERGHATKKAEEFQGIGH